MKATGIVRRIDDLGRIVIPKEIRNKLRIESGTPLELWLDGNNIVFNKFSAIREKQEEIGRHCRAIAEVTKKTVVVTDEDGVIVEATGFFEGQEGEKFQDIDEFPHHISRDIIEEGETIGEISVCFNEKEWENTPIYKLETIKVLVEMSAMTLGDNEPEDEDE